jgi:hypothetical protein
LVLVIGSFLLRSELCYRIYSIVDRRAPVGKPDQQGREPGRIAAQSLAEQLRLHGHAVRVANDPMAALALASESRFDVAVLDIGLPIMDGYELA